ncbi:MAG: TetR/AcrR family transcriptional regulator [Rhodoglobus sp.]|nr:TetR/AcrR family transcriptional regulator [Rhodoglobus sp.]
MVTRDPDAKRRQLVQAALAEFAAHGIAGARIDRIAKAANCSAGLVYTYFGSKDDLFSAAFDSLIETVLEEAPITPDDLPEYAGKLFDGYEDHPEVARFLTWHRLESDPDRAPNAAAIASTADKIAAIEDAQRRGVLPEHLVPAELLGMILQISAVWTAATPEFGEAVAQYTRADRRRVVTDAVAALIRP